MNKSRFRYAIKSMFKDTKVRYGGSAALLVVLVVAILVVLNLVVSSFDFRFDLTANKLFSLSTQSEQLLRQLDKDVTIYALYRTGRENATVSEVINQYVKASDRVKFEYVDPLLNPQFVEKYKGGEATPDLGSVIVTSGEKFRVLQPNDFVNYAYYYYQMVPESIAIEQQITSAILYVSTEQHPVVYSIVGHDEAELNYSFIDMAKKENYRIEDLDLLTVEAVPEDAAMVLLLSPVKDLTEEEDRKLRDYLKDGGRMIMLLDYVEDERPYLEGLLASYGLRVEKQFVIEGDASSRINNPFYLIPNYQSHMVTDPLVAARHLLVVPFPQPISVLQARRASLKIEPLLTSSDNSWAKSDFEGQTWNRMEGEPLGPFNVAVAVTDGEDYGPTPAKLVAISTSGLLVEQFDQLSRGANSDFVINSFNWLNEAKENITVRPKHFKDTYLSITHMQQLILAAAFVVVLPALVFLTGFVVWKRRRNL